MKIFSSNWINCITETEARIGDILAREFPIKNDSFHSRAEARLKLKGWAASHGIRILSFWDYGETKRKNPELHLVPSPHPDIHDSGDTFLVFDDELATKILVLGGVP